jgi:antitoxin VapB
MALSIKNQDVERLIEEVVQMTGESKTEAVRKALEERRQRLFLQATTHRDSAVRILSFLQEEAWPQIPSQMLGAQLTKEEEEAILGYGEKGV